VYLRFSTANSTSVDLLNYRNTYNMDNSLVNIRVYYWHFKIATDRPWIFVERNGFWKHYYEFDGAKPKEPLVAVYKFFL
jgi:hypothetical protein